MDGCEELLHVKLDDRGVLGLRQDLEQILITQEVESWKFGPFDLQVII